MTLALVPLPSEVAKLIVCYCIRVRIHLLHSCYVVGFGDLVLAMHELRHGKASAFWRDFFLCFLVFVHQETYHQFFLSWSVHTLVLRSYCFLTLPEKKRKTDILPLEFSDLRSFQASPNFTNVSGTIFAVSSSLAFSDSNFVK